MRVRQLGFALSIIAGAQTLPAQVQSRPPYPAILQQRQEFFGNVGAVSIVADGTTRIHGVGGGGASWDTGPGPWFVGGVVSAWVAPRDRGVSAYDLSVGIRATRVLSDGGTEARGGVGIAVAGVDVQAGVDRIQRDAIGFTVAAGIAQEHPLSADYGLVYSADLAILTMPPRDARDPYIRSPVVLFGVGLRHHHFVRDADTPRRPWPWPARPRPPVVNP